jgi:hypothetical protein
VPEQEVALVESLAAQPARDLAVVLACVARATGRDHVRQGVAATAGDRKDTVLLQSGGGQAAICAAAPFQDKSVPLGCAEVVLDSVKSSVPTLRVAGTQPGRGAAGKPAATAHEMTLPPTALASSSSRRATIAEHHQADDPPCRGMGEFVHQSDLVRRWPQQTTRDSDQPVRLWVIVTPSGSGSGARTAVVKPVTLLDRTVPGVPEPSAIPSSASGRRPRIRLPDTE